MYTRYSILHHYERASSSNAAGEDEVPIARGPWWNRGKGHFGWNSRIEYTLGVYVVLSISSLVVPRPAQSSHNGRQLIWERGTHDPQRHKWVARTIMMLIWAFTKPCTNEYGCAHLSVSCRENLLRSSTASRPISLSVETTKGVKCLCCSRQLCKYFFFFSNSCVARTLWGSRDRYDLTSVSVMRTSTMTSVPRDQKPQMSRSLCSSLLEHDKCWTGDLGSRDSRSLNSAFGLDHGFNANCWGN
jgi:hypothetical protein